MYSDGYVTPSVQVPQARCETSRTWWAKDQYQTRLKNWGVTEVKPRPEHGFVESIFSGRRKYFAVSLYVPDEETGAYVGQQMEALRSSAELFGPSASLFLGAPMISRQSTMMRRLTAAAGVHGSASRVYFDGSIQHVGVSRLGSSVPSATHPNDVSRTRVAFSATGLQKRGCE
eukprot:CAMPEP_0117512712 /NCGR_PEP_ID=MMETSP0784-20121206/29176_1 /TAXON_ID=39447 /ORGANISM="" /LENGTH=172 /DNA_ID=CAMNT_0005308447 /DNA_START=75 /DNA_END=595 /DNA_ORIENTATION=-